MTDYSVLASKVDGRIVMCVIVEDEVVFTAQTVGDAHYQSWSKDIQHEWVGLNVLQSLIKRDKRGDFNGQVVNKIETKE